MESLSVVIQLVSLLGAFAFLFVIFRLIVRGRLREEYSIVWIFSTLILIVFSIWRKGLEQIAALLGVYYPPSLIFLGAIFAILVFLIHLSVVNSRLQGQIKDLTHEVAYLRHDLDRLTTGIRAEQTAPAPMELTAEQPAHSETVTRPSDAAQPVPA